MLLFFLVLTIRTPARRRTFWNCVTCWNIWRFMNVINNEVYRVRKPTKPPLNSQVVGITFARLSIKARTSTNFEVVAVWFIGKRYAPESTVGADRKKEKKVSLSHYWALSQCHRIIFYLLHKRSLTWHKYRIHITQSVRLYREVGHKNSIKHVLCRRWLDLKSSGIARAIVRFADNEKCHSAVRNHWTLSASSI